MREQPRRQLLGHGHGGVAEEADFVEPLVEGQGQGLDDEGAGRVDEDQVRDRLRGFEQLLGDFVGDDAAGRPALG